MLTLLIILNGLLPLAYLVALIDYAATFFLRTRQTGRGWVLPGVLAGHAVFLVLLGVHLARPVPANSFELLSVLALSVGVIYVVVEWAARERRTGVFVTLLAFVLQYGATLFLPHVDFANPRPGLAHVLSPLHLLPAVVAYAALAMSALHGLLHRLAIRDLRRRRFGLLFDRLPPIERLGTLCWHALGLGFVFMTLTIVSGAMMSHGEAYGLGTKLVMKVLASSVAWLVFAVAIAGRLLARWSMPRVSSIAVGGFVVVAIMLVLSMVL